MAWHARGRSSLPFFVLRCQQMGHGKLPPRPKHDNAMPPPACTEGTRARGPGDSANGGHGTLRYILRPDPVSISHLLSERKRENRSAHSNFGRCDGTSETDRV